jgi:hypothetical protein
LGILSVLQPGKAAGELSGLAAESKMPIASIVVSFKAQQFLWNLVHLISLVADFKVNASPAFPIQNPHARRISVRRRNVLALNAREVA